MALPRRQRRLLSGIDHQMAAEAPLLAWQFDMFARPSAYLPRPSHEQLPTWTSRFWSSVWEPLAAWAWLAPPLPGSLRADGYAGPGGDRGPSPRPSSPARQKDGRPGQS